MITSFAITIIILVMILGCIPYLAWMIVTAVRRIMLGENATPVF